MSNNEWDYYLARLENLDEKKTVLPFELFEINKGFKIYRGEDDAFSSVACFRVKNSKFTFDEIEKVKDKIRTFASFYSMESNTALEFHVPNQMIKCKEKSKFGKIRGMSRESQGFAFPDDWKHNLGIEARLHQSKKLWLIFSEIKEGKLKNHIENALHYYYYGKKASRKEEKIINYTIAFEILYLESKGELSYKLANRASFILHPITWNYRKGAFDLLRKMYDIRSRIVHEGVSKKELHPVNLIQIENMLKTSIKLFMMLSKEYKTKEAIINYIEKGLLTGKTKLIDMKEFHTYFRD